MSSVWLSNSPGYLTSTNAVAGVAVVVSSCDTDGLLTLELLDVLDSQSFDDRRPTYAIGFDRISAIRINPWAPTNLGFPAICFIPSIPGDPRTRLGATANAKGPSRALERTTNHHCVTAWANSFAITTPLRLLVIVPQTRDLTPSGHKDPSDPYTRRRDSRRAPASAFLLMRLLQQVTL